MNHDNPADKLIEKVDRRDKLVRIIEVGMLFILAMAVFFTVWRLQMVINQNQVDAIRRSKQATIDRNDTKNYIKCIVLLRYDAAPEEFNTREGAEKALDRCAKTTQ